MWQELLIGSLSIKAKAFLLVNLPKETRKGQVVEFESIRKMLM